MKETLDKSIRTLRHVIYGLSLATAAAQGATADKTSCEDKLIRHATDYMNCRLNAEDKLVKGQPVDDNKRAKQKCDDIYKKRIDAAKARWGEDLCLAHKDSSTSSEPPLELGMIHEVDLIRAMVTGKSPDPIPGKLIIYNNCNRSLKLMSPTDGSTINGVVVNSGDSVTYSTTADLAAEQPHTIMVAPITTKAECAKLSCGNWSDIQKPGQREGYMWDNNPLFAAYCQPTNTAAKQCGQATEYCCGPDMNYDMTFGTTFEITPNNKATGKDFMDLSTNYGSGPNSPPTLCSSPNADPNNCVTETANIFYNVPVSVEMNNSSACTFPNGGPGLSCTEAGCPDAYQTPTDPKGQVACPIGTGYVVTYCPGSSQLPALTSLSSGQNKITIQNNLNTTSPCPAGNTVTVFTSDGGQQVIQPGGNSIAVSGDYSSGSGLGIQVNNWYWTSVDLPVQKGPPQNPDNSGAQFTISDQCVLSQAPPVYGKGIETYKIASVQAQKSDSGCLITIDKKQPYTDAVTPECCAPPINGWNNVCAAGSWGKTNNNITPWPPQ